MNNEIKRRESSGYGKVCGVGIYEPRILCMTESPKTKKAYKIWNSMLQRTSAAYAAQRPSYAGTSVAPEFYRFSEFYEWVVKQPGWSMDGFQLDKDLLKKGNRTYSSETCVFLPQRINSLLITHRSRRGELPLGVVNGRREGKYEARVSDGRTKINLGTFSDVPAAFAAYKAGKERLVRKIADQYKCVIDGRAYEALMSYQVNIND